MEGVGVLTFCLNKTTARSSNPVILPELNDIKITWTLCRYQALFCKKKKIIIIIKIDKEVFDIFSLNANYKPRSQTEITKNLRIVADYTAYT